MQIEREDAGATAEAVGDAPGETERVSYIFFAISND